MGIKYFDMETHRVLYAESGTPLFEMDIDIEVPCSISKEGLRGNLHHLANELMIDLVVRKIDPFNHMGNQNCLVLLIISYEFDET
jgi:glycine cleavage system regulatory protein